MHLFRGFLCVSSLLANLLLHPLSLLFKMRHFALYVLSISATGRRLLSGVLLFSISGRGSAHLFWNFLLIRRR